MLRMIVSDWNGTLFSDPLEEKFFQGLCKKAFYKALRKMSLRTMTSLLMRGAWGFREYLSAKGRKTKTLEHIAKLVEILNPCVFAGLTQAELDEYAWKYAFQIQKKLDMRLIWPIRRLVREDGMPLVVISSGCKEGIIPAMELMDIRVSEVVANVFVMDESGITTGFDFKITDNKADLLADILAERGVDASEVMYLGDSLADEECFSMVGYPVISFFAEDALKEKFARKLGTFVPVDQDDFEKYLEKITK